MSIIIQSGSNILVFSRKVDLPWIESAIPNWPWLLLLVGGDGGDQDSHDEGDHDG